MRRPPGPIESYCLIKNKFLSNLFFVVAFKFFTFFCLPIKPPAAQSVREKPRIWARKLRFTAVAAVLAPRCSGLMVNGKLSCGAGYWLLEAAGRHGGGVLGFTM